MHGTARGDGATGGGRARPARTHKTALVVIPPAAQWAPIQAIRERYDRQVRRWMPHINLLYPFAPPERWEKLFPRLVRACATLQPFSLRMGEIRYFKHSRGGYTLWLAPEPVAAFQRLRRTLLQAAPGYDEGGGFNPHLSIGQVARLGSLNRLLDELQQEWEPLEFPVRAVSLIRRGDPPEDRFHPVRTFDLGAGESGEAGGGGVATGAHRRGEEGVQTPSRSERSRGRVHGRP